MARRPARPLPLARLRPGVVRLRFLPFILVNALNLNKIPWSFRLVKNNRAAVEKRPIPGDNSAQNLTQPIDLPWRPLWRE
jgi:hypothetical protein